MFEGIDSRTNVRYNNFRTNVRGGFHMKRKNIKKVILLIIAVFCLTAFAQLKKVDGSSKLTYTTVTVYPGDTLWKIASEHNMGESDIRKAIYKIRKLNNLKSAVIMPGQELVIPLN